MSKFTDIAPRMMARLMHEFGIDVESAAAIAGNAGHESGGFLLMQELKPTVKGSKGGTGFFQWTAVRRRQFEAWCKTNELSPSSEDGNVGFLVEELKGPERAAIPAVQRAAGLEAKVKAFEMGYERAGVKHYPERFAWAKKALAAYNAAFNGTADTSEDDALDFAKIKSAQARLKELGFGMVGIVDGRMGANTVAAISAFQHDNGLETTGKLTPETIEALGQADHRVISPERANGQPESSRIVNSANLQIGTGSAVTVGGVGLELAGKVSSHLGDASDALDKVDSAKGIFDRLAEYLEPLTALGQVVAAHPGIMLGAAGMLIAGTAWLIRHYRILDFRSGKTA